MEFILFAATVVALVCLLVITKHSSVFTRRFNILPALGLLVILTGSVIGYEFFHLSGGPIPITIDRLVLGGMGGCFALLLLDGRERIRTLNLVDFSIVLLLVITTLSTISHDFTFQGNLPASRLLFFYFLPAALYVVMRHVQISENDLKLIAFGLGGLAIYLALTAVAETRGWAAIVFPRFIMDPGFAEFLGRGRGPFLNPVSNGIFQVVGLCCIWMWWPDSSLRKKGFLLVAAAIMIAGVYCTFTRSVWMGLVLAAAVFVFLPASTSTKGMMVLAATCVAVGAFPFLSNKLISFQRDKNVSVADQEQSARLRPLFLVVATRMIQDRPLFGCGFGQYAREKTPYLQDSTAKYPLRKTETYFQHNVFLANVTELGLVGLGSLLLMLSLIGRTAWFTWKNRRSSLWHRQFGLLMLVMLANHFANGMFHDVGIIPMSNMLLFFLAGITNNLFTGPPRRQAAGRPPQLPASLPQVA